MLFKVLNEELLQNPVVHSHGKWLRLVSFNIFNSNGMSFPSKCGGNSGRLLKRQSFFFQVEISGGRGKPSTIIDKDEGLGKVNI